MDGHDQQKGKQNVASSRSTTQLPTRERANVVTGPYHERATFDHGISDDVLHGHREAGPDLQASVPTSPDAVQDADLAYLEAVSGLGEMFDDHAQSTEDLFGATDFDQQPFEHRHGFRFGTFDRAPSTLSVLFSDTQPDETMITAQKSREEILDRPDCNASNAQAPIPGGPSAESTRSVWQIDPGRHMHTWYEAWFHKELPLQQGQSRGGIDNLATRNIGVDINQNILHGTGASLADQISQPDDAYRRIQKRPLQQERSTILGCRRLQQSSFRKQLKRRQAIENGEKLQCEYCHRDFKGKRADNRTRHYKLYCKVIERVDRARREMLKHESKVRKNAKSIKRSDQARPGASNLSHSPRPSHAPQSRIEAGPSRLAARHTEMAAGQHIANEAAYVLQSNEADRINLAAEYPYHHEFVPPAPHQPPRQSPCDPRHDFQYLLGTRRLGESPHASRPSRNPASSDQSPELARSPLSRRDNPDQALDPHSPLAWPQGLHEDSESCYAIAGLGDKPDSPSESSPPPNTGQDSDRFLSERARGKWRQEN